MSDPSNGLEENSHPLQRTGAPALQGPLTPPDDDYIPVPATISLTLPRELMERILLLLDIKFMLKCRLVNREFHAIIQSSTLLQYYLACKASGVIDNPQSPLSYAERLEALKDREDAWRKLKPVFEMTIKANDLPSTLYELTAGNFFLGDKNRKDLYYCRLPSSPQDNPQWFRISGHGPGQSWSDSGSIIEMGMALYEHDLVVNVISSEVGNQADMQRHSLDLVLLKFSTGEVHPFALHPLIHVQRSPSSQPYISIKIVGDNIALVVHDEDGSKLFIFDWKTGHKRLQHKATEDAYKNSILVFVSPELLLVPNCILSHFEVWHLFPSHPNPKPPVQKISLQIPAVSDNYYIISIGCHGEPSPFLHSMPYFPPRPFFPSWENSIIVVSLLLGPIPQLQYIYKLIMHRRALLDMIQKLTSPSLQEVRWADWGPPISRWFQVNGTVRGSGQRQVFLEPSPRDKLKCIVGVEDFNLYNVRRNAGMTAQLRGEGEHNSGNGNNGEGKKEGNEEELEILKHEGVFSEEVYMGLKRVVYHAPGEYDLHAVLMDEERLLGLKVSTRK
ncbi:hypothetical protein JOM56_005680 [Amanita muscaria]